MALHTDIWVGIAVELGGANGREAKALRKGLFFINQCSDECLLYGAQVSLCLIRLSYTLYLSTEHSIKRKLVLICSRRLSSHQNWMEEVRWRNTGSLWTTWEGVKLHTVACGKCGQIVHCYSLITWLFPASRVCADLTSYIVSTLGNVEPRPHTHRLFFCLFYCGDTSCKTFASCGNPFTCHPLFCQSDPEGKMNER